MKTLKIVALSLLLVVGIVGGWLMRGVADNDSARNVTQVAVDVMADATTSAFAQKKVKGVSPTKAVEPRGTYYPNTESLGKNEMRIVSLGTGMPNQRPAQKATCWLVELGNGDKFLFDIGTGASDNIAALQIPYDYINKVFISHLHADHWGDLNALYVGSIISGRIMPLKVWGPTGDSEELGTKYAVEHMKKSLAWDIKGRLGRFPETCFEIEINEFDYKAVNQVVYQENGVTITSFPANHAIDGSVSFKLVWNDLVFVFSGDTYPNKWYVDAAKGADVAIHECFITVPDLVDKMKFPVSRALDVGTQIHTAPPAFGKVMSMVQPRMAIAYHFFNDFDTAPKILEGVRSTYDGPLSLADDMQVWNVTKDNITVRDIVFEERVWSPEIVYQPPPPDPSLFTLPSDYIVSGNLDVSDIIAGIYERANKMYGTDLKPVQ